MSRQLESTVVPGASARWTMTGTVPLKHAPHLYTIAKQLMRLPSTLRNLMSAVCVVCVVKHAAPSDSFMTHLRVTHDSPSKAGSRHIHIEM